MLKLFKKYKTIYNYLAMIIVLTGLLLRLTIDTSNDQYIRCQFKKYSKVDIAMYRAELEYLKTRDPKTNEIPYNIKEREIKFVSQIPSRKDFERMEQLKESGKFYKPYIQQQDWQSNGPVNIAGRMKDIVFDITDENIMLAASASGGIFRTVNSGNSWIKTSSPEHEQSVYCIAQDRRIGKTKTWYYGTGELLSTTNRKFATYARTVGMGNGIYKSEDNGLSWEHLSSTKTQNTTQLGEMFQQVWDIEIDNSIVEQDVVYAACFGAVMKSTDGGDNWNLEIGDLNNKAFSTDIEITSDNSMIYIGLSSFTLNGKRPAKTGIFRSKKGDNWVEITPLDFPEETRLIKIESAPSNPNVVYVLTETPIDIADSFYAFAASEHTFWKYTYNPETDDGTWENRTKNLPYQSMTNINKVLTEGFNTLGGYCFTFNVKPDNENIVFIGGTNLFRSTTGFGDTSNTKMLGGYGTGLHPDQHAVEFLPSNPNVLYNASDGGVTVSQNCTASNVVWTEKNSGMTSSQYYSVSFDHATDYNELLIGGLQDQGTAMKSASSKKLWELIFGGDGLSCYIANNREFLIVTVYDGNIYGGKFLDNNKLSLTYNDYLTSNEVAGQQFNFFTLFDVEPNNNDELYLVAQNVIYRKSGLKKAINNSSQRNLNWLRLHNSMLPANENITAIKLSTNPKNRLYYGSDKGKVYRIDGANSGNPDKQEITGSSFPVNGYVSCIAVDPNDADNLFVVFSNYNVQSIFYSSNGGVNWIQQGGNLEENPDGSGAGPSIRWLEILHRGDGTIYFAGTSTGLYSTTYLAGNQTIWLKESPELIGNIKIDMVVARQSDGFVAVATQGNGIYTTYVDKVETDSVNTITHLNISNYPNPCADYTTFELEIPYVDAYKLSIYDLEGRFVELITEKYFGKGKHPVYYSTRKLAQGYYYYILESKDWRIIGKMLKVN